ncbi:MAG: prepilin-type N-terminal cleavage/methylation domain-containing protein, partial [Deltaproteobacteria bacterium]|nr:prepilin-type N-terminal cleavage/methylation domain-containing protein [Deltaproteobacteria bacterium]
MRTRRGPFLGSSNRCQGFTLLEIMIVVAIMGILAAALAVRIMGKPGEAKTL